jgi:hypothetical protein
MKRPVEGVQAGTNSNTWGKNRWRRSVIETYTYNGGDIRAVRPVVEVWVTSDIQPSVLGEVLAGQRGWGTNEHDRG